MDYSRQYLQFHDPSDDHFRWQSEASYAELKPFLPADRDAPILEIGCGMGFALGGLLQAGYTRVSGIDASPHQVDACAQRSLPAELVPVPETRAFLERNRRQFGFAYAIDVLEHIPPSDLIDLLQLVRTALKPGATFVCRVPNANSVLGPRMRYIDWTHLSAFTESSLDFVLHNAGFSDVAVQETTVLMPGTPNSWTARTLRRVLRWRQRLTFAVEHGREFADKVPLTLNILGSGRA